MKKQLHAFAIIFFLSFKYLFANLGIFCINLRIQYATINWRRSKKFNLYNPTLEATVYKRNSCWNIARDGNYFGNFETKKEAMASARQMWLEDGKLIETIDKLQNQKNKILNKYKWHKDSIPEETNKNDVNFKAKYDLVEKVSCSRKLESK